MNRPDLIVAKFGSSVLRSEEDLPAAAHEIYRHVRDGRKVVAVVSAIGSTTDRLLAMARRWSDGLGETVDASDGLNEGAVAALLSTGELRSTALLSLALDRAGVPVVALDPHAAGLRTRGRLTDADPVRLDGRAILRALEHHPVVVVPGFVGVDVTSRRLSLLGRGGSDLSAVFLAHRLGASRCVLLKDVDGVYTTDPNRHGTAALRYDRLTWSDAINVAGKLVQRKALDYAREHRVTIEVTAFGSMVSTFIDDGPTGIGGEPSKRRPLRVGLLGLGVVGTGVYERLTALPELFEVVGVAVRNANRPREVHVPNDRLFEGVEAALDWDCDLVIEAVGGLEPVGAVVEALLARGVSVATANKALVAARGEALRAAAAGAGARFRCGAAVAGAVPVLERVTALRRSGSRPRVIEGVLNGTTNFVLDRVSEGTPLDEAVALAKRMGYAEADPSQDLAGLDAARKLAILASAAFGTNVPLESVTYEGVWDAGTVGRDVARRGGVLRLVARCEETDHGVRASVRLRAVPRDHPLASLRDADNGVSIECVNGRREWLHGKGAGRYPTTEAVIGDALAIRAALIREATRESTSAGAA